MNEQTPVALPALNATPAKTTWNTPRRFMWTSIAIFAVSLVFNGFYIESDNPTAWSSCFGLLLIGWLGIFDGIIAWFANPLLVASWILSRMRRTRKIAFVLAFAALLVAVSFLLVSDVMRDEAGNRARVSTYGIGYWLWLTSITVAMFGAALGVRADRFAAPIHPTPPPLPPQ